MADVDIDLTDRTKILDLINHIPATLENGKKHNTGVYVQSIPINPLTGQSSISYHQAETRGYFKIDFLNVNAYDGVRNEDHLTQLLNTDPIWDLLGEQEVCDKLFHVKGYHNLLKDLQPKSLLELAMVLALIRPGKKHLIPTCKESGFDSIKDDIWVKPSDGSYIFKKSHAHSYAALIIVQLNVLCETLITGFGNTH